MNLYSTSAALIVGVECKECILNSSGRPEASVKWDKCVPHIVLPHSNVARALFCQDINNGAINSGKFKNKHIPTTLARFHARSDVVHTRCANQSRHVTAGVITGGSACGGHPTDVSVNRRLAAAVTCSIVQQSSCAA